MKLMIDTNEPPENLSENFRLVGWIIVFLVLGISAILFYQYAI